MLSTGCFMNRLMTYINRNRLKASSLHVCINFMELSTKDSGHDTVTSECFYTLKVLHISVEHWLINGLRFIVTSVFIVSYFSAFSEGLFLCFNLPGFHNLLWPLSLGSFLHFKLVSLHLSWLVIITTLSVHWNIM